MKDKLLMILFVLVLGSVLTASLLAVNNYTSPIIEKNNLMTIKASILNALGIPYDEKSIEDLFSMYVREEKRGDRTLYYSNNGDVAFEISGSGLWGPINGVLSLQRDLKTIKKLVIIYQEETPGLGGRISENEFLDRFQGKSIIPKVELVAPGKAQTDNQIDGITGATMSVKALQSILNNEIETYASLFEVKAP